MIFPMFRSFPDPDQVLADLKPIRKLMHDALLEGCEQAVWYHEQHEFDPIDPHVHAALTRQAAASYLDQRGLASLGFTQPRGANASLHLVGEQYEIRVLKAEREREIPYPRTDTRTDYFHQLTLGGAFAETPMTSMLFAPPTKLVVLWGTDGNFQLSAFDLACPRSVGENRVEYYWLLPFSVDSQSVLGGQPAASQIDDLAVQPKLVSGNVVQDA